MKHTKTFALGFAAFGLALTTLAVDTHDYSTYIKLKGNTTLSDSVGGCPGASAWNPEGEMTDSGYYLIPSGYTLTSATKSTGPAGGTWPMAELAIEGTFVVYTSGNRSKAAITPRLALLPGGTISLANYAYSTLNGDTLDIRGTAANPSSIEYRYATANNNANYYPQLNIAFNGDTDGVVKFMYTGTDTNYSDFQRAFRVKGGFANFLGTVIVDGARTWLRPMTDATTFDIGGTLCVTNGANVYLGAFSPTFGALVMSEDATLQIGGNQTLTVGDATFGAATLEIAPGGKLVLTNSFIATAPIKLKLSGEWGDDKRPVVTLPVGKGMLRIADFLIAFDYVPQFRYVPHVETADGVQTLWIENRNPDVKDETTGYVVQTKADGSSASYSIGSYNMAGNWSEADQAPHSGTNYYTARYFRDKSASNAKFAGDSLTQAYVFRLARTSFRIDDWRVVPNDETNYDKRTGLTTAGGKGTFTFDGLLTVFTTSACPFTLYGGLSTLNDDGTVKSSQTYVMNAKIVGAADAAIAAEGAQTRAPGVAEGQAVCEFPGDMSEYYGTIYVGTNQTVRLGSRGLTNGTLVVRTAYSKVSTTAGAGEYVPVKRYVTQTSSEVNVPASTELAVTAGADITGTLTKTGAGMLSFGGTAMAGADACVSVSEGLFKAAAVDAVDGIQLCFGEGAKLCVDVEATGDLGSFGARNVSIETPFVPAAEGGSIPVSFTGELSGNGATVAVCTISATATAPTFSLPTRFSKLKVLSSDWRANGDGTRTFEVQFVKPGLIISFK